jgi:hypothetical protein
MRSPDMTRSDEDRNTWTSIALRDRRLLADRASSDEGGVLCG